jgi:DNA-binding transcriptional LysR family regulator
MEMRQLRCLAGVVEERSIFRAAARLTMSRPPLSATIARMERELGVRLPDRLGPELARRAAATAAAQPDRPGPAVAGR